MLQSPFITSGGDWSITYTWKWLFSIFKLTFIVDNL